MQDNKIMVEVPINISLYSSSVVGSITLEIRSAEVEYDSMTPMLWSLNNLLKTSRIVALSRVVDPDTNNIITRSMPMAEGIAKLINQEMVNIATMSTTIH